MKLKESIYGRIKKNKNLLAIYTLLSRIRNGDKQMVDLILSIDDRADYLKIERNGNENSGKIIYVITETGKNYGFFAEFRRTLAALYYAEKLGLIPCVRWGENFAYYEPKGVDGIYNAFEYYFMPINSDIDISKSYTVTYCKLAQTQEISLMNNSKGYLVAEDYENILANILKRYIHIREELVEDFEKQAFQIGENKNILGIHYRGTDFKCGYNNHPVVIQKEQTIETAKKLIEEYNIDLIFLATDDMYALEEFKEEFGDKLEFFKDVYRGTDNTNIAFSESSRKMHHYRLGREILRDVYMLSKCNYLISGLSQVSLAAQLFKKSRGENFIEKVIINNGINKGTNEFNVMNI